MKKFLSKQKNGNWYLYYEDENGKRCKVTTKTKKKGEANQFLVEFGKTFFKDFNFTLEECIEKYIKFKKHLLAKHTIIDITSTLKEFQKLLDNKKIREITQEDINDYIIFISKKNIKSAVLVKITKVQTFFKFCVFSKYIVNNFYFEKPKATQKEKEFLTVQEFNKIIVNCKNKDLEDVLTVGFFTGLRISEIISLTWSNINFTIKRIILNNENFTTKNKKTRRISITNVVYYILKRRYNFKNNDFVFTHRNKKWDVGGLQVLTRKFFDKMVIDKKITYHNLRHSYASNLLLAGVSPAYIAKLLGHSDLSTMLSYSHVVDDLKDVADVFNSYCDSFNNNQETTKVEKTIIENLDISKN
jgi:integrase